MGQLSINQYQQAIKDNALIPRQIKALQILYSQPNSSATAIQLSKLIHPTKSAAIISSGRIGKIGKALANYWNIVPGTYVDNGVERPAYFTVVSEIYDRKIGWTLYDNLKSALENLGLVNKNGAEITERLSTEIQPYEEEIYFKEGKVIKVLVDKYERNQKARIKCIEYYGDKCMICGFDFEKVYGEIASDFIHVHHINQLADIKGEYNVDPIKNLLPVCANCHSVLHLKYPAMKPEELKLLIEKNSR